MNVKALPLLLCVFLLCGCSKEMPEGETLTDLKNFLMRSERSIKMSTALLSGDLLFEAVW